MKTITRADVAETIYQEIGLSRKDSNEILDMILDEITQELKALSTPKFKVNTGVIENDKLNISSVVEALEIKLIEIKLK